MQKPKRFIRRNFLQRTHFAELREGIAELGYFILPMAKRFRANRRDFVAVHKNNRQQFLIVRVAHGGSTTIKPYCSKHQYVDVQKLIDELRVSGTRVRWLQQVPLTQPNLTLEHFLSVPGREEHRDLLTPMQTAG